MMIKYNQENRMYYIRDLGEGSGTFVKLDTELVNYFSLAYFSDLEKRLHRLVRRFAHARVDFARLDDWTE